MPSLGEVQRGNAIGYAVNSYWQWCACRVCDAERWVYLVRKGVPQYTRCRTCANHSKRGKVINRGKGWRYTTEGYRERLLHEGDQFYTMAYIESGRWYGFVLEHRWVMARHLDRPLTSKERVHHVNGIRDDNRIENLVLTNDKEHPRGYSAAYKDGYERGYADGYAGVLPLKL